MAAEPLTFPQPQPQKQPRKRNGNERREAEHLAASLRLLSAETVYGCESVRAILERARAAAEQLAALDYYSERDLVLHCIVVRGCNSIREIREDLQEVDQLTLSYWATRRVLADLAALLLIEERKATAYNKQGEPDLTYWPLVAGGCPCQRCRQPRTP